uniref:Hemocyanin subunit 1 n=1 Tax=Euprymna scolopes TaxID=6613 RepID=A0A077B6R8_EUPSC|nr:hemocyanin subunit 1 [Euprymna scolopes]
MRRLNHLPLLCLAVILTLWMSGSNTVNGNLVRKNVDTLSHEEIISLQVALRSMQDDDGATGYQAISAYHGEPADCKAADGSSIVCCLHGMPTFPLWHRLYIVQFEQALAAHGSALGVPYWDWTKPMDHLPELVQHPLFIDPNGQKAKKNVFYSGEIKFENKVTARAVDARLYEASQKGAKNFLLEGVLNALEQEDYCHFEVQFEVAHNPIHYLVGGRFTHSMSSLEYTSYDPLFFLHHSNVERQFALWQALQKHRGLPTRPNCGLNLFHNPMEPFGRDTNPFAITKDNAKPSSLFEYEHLGYAYDDLTLNGMSVEELDSFLKSRKNQARAFANFRLGGIKTSANVRINICIPNKDGRHSDNCDNYAGGFFILGGVHEMPWNFAYPYLHEITDKVISLGLPLSGDYYVQAVVTAINGTLLPDGIIPSPIVSYVPGHGHLDDEMKNVDEMKLSTRKDLSSLTDEEEYELRQAMERFMSDKSINGYQALAEFHGLPAKCPRPDAQNRVACCVHGMATFPHWHRLVVVQFENALMARGSQIGVPYWDWTKPITALPHLLGDETYVDPYTKETKANPFFSSAIEFLDAGVHTTRVIDPRLFKQPSVGDHSAMYDGMLLAFEQEDFCDFEVQFEVTHNAIHAWTGGAEPYSMSSLHYTSFDPMFWFHHSEVDRLWAIWQALQVHRKLPYKCHCASSEVYRPMKPFAFEPPLNNDHQTHSHSVPTHIYDYQAELKYAYDTLFFGGMSVRELQGHIDNNKHKDRVFAGFLFMGIKTSAIVDFYVVAAGNEFMAGSVAVLGGSKEMSWRFDRVYKHEITGALAALGVDKYAEYTLRVDIKDVNGTALPATTLPQPTVIFVPGKADTDVEFDEQHRSRKNVDSMTKTEMDSIRSALTAFAADKSANGFQQVAAFHGSTKWCPSPDAAQKYACCHHGMATFPHWHRLVTLNYENGLRRNGYSGGVPYWDWTRPIDALPALVLEEQYTDVNGEAHPNPFFSGAIDEAGAVTSRAPSANLFEKPEFGKYTHLANEIIFALEQEDFCDFEVQYEIAHNHIHALVGGTEPFSMASLEYSAFDPIFMLHHSNVDRIWSTWQALQKFRGKPYNTANCAIEMLRKPMSPFSLASDINPDSMTREHSVPFDVFDYKKNFHYEYDTLELNGLSIPQLSREINRRKAKNRVLVTFMLEGLKKSVLVEYFIKDDGSDNKMKAGEFYVLGSENEMPWKFDRAYKADITHTMDEMKLHYTDKYHIEYTVTDLTGAEVAGVSLSSSVVYEPGLGKFGEGRAWIEPVTSASRIRKSLDDLSGGEIESLRNTFKQMTKDGRYQEIASFHGLPAQCPNADGTVVFTCCLHGMPTFPHWHRLYLSLVEDELLARGAGVAVPYWNWIEPFDRLPAFFNDATYYNSRTLHIESNPFFNGAIDFASTVTDRDAHELLYGNKNLYDEALFVLEQTDFCEFEVQLEVLHNRIHSLLGGREVYSMASLDFAAYDPVFFLHHSNVDRLWAIWQELQRYRKLPYNEANCALPLLNEPMRPFSNSTANQDRLTFTNSRPNDVFDYQNVLHYKYDTLTFEGLSIPELEALINKRQDHDRVFAGFLLHGIKTSAEVHIYICVPTGVNEENCGNFVGTFSVLGGESEMSWNFDRLYRYEITDDLMLLGLNHNSHFRIAVEIITANRSMADSNIFPTPTVIFVPTADSEHKESWGGVITSANRIRKNLKDLKKEEMICFADAFRLMAADGRYEEIAAFHGLPAQCPDETGDNVYTCCLHGMPVFPHWHRLYLALVENELLARGSCIAVPYWDWIEPFDELPPLINDLTYYNPKTDKTLPNPFLKGSVSFENTHTQRTLSSDIFGNMNMYDHALFALEQTDFCEFEIQYEVLHNTIHALIGGASKYSMSSLDYAAYDPIFFLHHSNVDRLWAVWQELQRYRKLEYNTATCAKNSLNKPMRPFSNSTANHDRLTYVNSKPNDVFDYQNVLHYKYETIEFSGLNIPQLENVLKNNKAHDRVFVGYSLHGIKASAFFRFYICVPVGAEKNCDHFGGTFSVLGGETEMPWQFDRPFRYDITPILNELNLNYKSDFTIKTEVIGVNGTKLNEKLFHDPSIIFVPKEERSFKSATNKNLYGNLVRKNVDRLSLQEINSLVHALKRMQKDQSADGFETIASFHAIPPLCPNPTAKHRHACCLHGMATFPQWHRLYVVQFEQALHRHGATVGVPYWDWTYPMKEVPNLLTSEKYVDPFTAVETFNPFNHGHISFISPETMTARDVSDHLFEQPGLGKQTWLFNNIILALEQTDYCDFEVQFEIVHNAIHSWLGGKEIYSLNHLHYAAYDPAFYLHHSNVDRLWVIWQELQKFRGLPAYESNCAIELMSQPLKPFSFGAPYNLNPMTTKYSKPADVFNYKDNFHYEYDMLEMNGMSIAQLESYIRQEKQKDRVFVGFLLHGFGSSAYATFDICNDAGECREGSHFSVLGGSTEMPWSFDRLYRIEITDILKDMGLEFDSHFTIKVQLAAHNGTELNHVLSEPTIVRIPPEKEHIEVAIPLNKIRRQIESLEERDIQNLMSALRRLKEDDSDFGFQTIAGYHGSKNCPSPDDAQYACCLHGMPTFPHWHRVYLLHFEDAMRRHGANVAVPYWDWTLPISSLPHLLADADYYDAWSDSVIENPFLRGFIKSEDTFTVRDIQPDLFKIAEGGKVSVLYKQVMLMFEQEDYCDFEVQLEVIHNTIHYLLGGHQKYAMSSLMYSSFDPIFYIHHSMVDRLWAIWQELQHFRKLPDNKAFCALDQMAFAMKPFFWESNPNPHTRSVAVPAKLFDYKSLGYIYDDLTFHGMSIAQLDAAIQNQKAKDRVFAGFLLHGIKTSADVHLKVCNEDICKDAGVLFILGGETEMPWHFDRNYRLEITSVLEEMKISFDDLFQHESKIHLEVLIKNVDGSPLDAGLLPKPSLIYLPAKHHAVEKEQPEMAGTLIRKNVDSLTPYEVGNLRDALAAVQADITKTGYQKIASYHGMPLSCKYDNGTALACCQHGMVTFPHWHRLYMKQMEDAMRARGARVGIPYWDWTIAFSSLPDLVTDEKNNPFHHAHIDVANTITTRNPRPQLFDDPEQGDESFFYRQIAFALEQRDFCDFEIQFEMGHNAIHSWVGGSSPYGMSTLHYTSYDPLFYLHHSNTDRIWAIWQALQKYRGLPYNSANCEINKLKKPMEPFSYEENPNPVTKAHSTGMKVFDYHELNYEYDNLNFHGMTIPQLEIHLEEIKQEDRVFAGFLLRAIGQSADVTFDICHNGKCEFAGTFCVLGGEHEMAWAFDRLFLYDITKALTKLSIDAYDDFKVQVGITSITGEKLPQSLLPPPTILFKPGKGSQQHH